MSDFLQKIVAHKQQEIAAAAVQASQSALASLARARRDYRGFAAALAAPHRVHIIAEIKRASPSKGDIGLGLDPAKLARAYATGGASAVSVLTDHAFFKGSREDLVAARAATSLPVLRKDFILAPYQVYESAAMGADAILLIVRILTDNELQVLYRLALDLGLDVLVEIHNEAEAARANRLGARLVGINNRDLAHFETDVSRARHVAAALHPETVVVAASGIHGVAEIHNTVAAGVTRFLIGEALVRAPDPAALLFELRAAGGAP
ncbi:MAG: indole-3-glycerol phosphate synthase TrpC [Kiritimatiellia bacterium]